MKILIFAGLGGHQTQANILYERFRDSEYPTEFITEENYIMPKVSNLSKYGGLKLFCSVFVVALYLVPTIIWVSLQDRRNIIIIFGPLSTFAVMLSCFILQRKCVVFETWSRFTTHSITYMFAKFLRLPVVVQNPSMSQDDNIFGRLG